MIRLLFEHCDISGIGKIVLTAGRNYGDFEKAVPEVTGFIPAEVYKQVRQTYWSS
jgi:hypothetical protein